MLIKFTDQITIQLKEMKQLNEKLMLENEDLVEKHETLKKDYDLSNMTHNKQLQSLIQNFSHVKDSMKASEIDVLNEKQ